MKKRKEWLHKKNVGTIGNFDLDTMLDSLSSQGYEIYNVYKNDKFEGFDIIAYKEVTDGK